MHELNKQAKNQKYGKSGHVLTPTRKQFPGAREAGAK